MSLHTEDANSEYVAPTAFSIDLTAFRDGRLSPDEYHERLTSRHGYSPEEASEYIDIEDMNDDFDL